MAKIRIKEKEDGSVEFSCWRQLEGEWLRVVGKVQPTEDGTIPYEGALAAVDAVVPFRARSAQDSASKARVA